MTTQRSISQRRRIGSAVLRQCRLTPFAVALTVALWVIAAATDSIANGPGFGKVGHVGFSWHLVVKGEWWTPLTSALFAGNFASYILASVMILGLVGLAEFTMGTARTVLAFVVGHLGGLVLYLGVVDVGTLLGSVWLDSLRQAVLIGPFAGTLAAVLAASPRISSLWRRRLRSASLAAVLMLLMYIGHAQNLLAFVGLLVGWGLGWALRPDLSRFRVVKSTSREIRALLAMVVAIFALGPLLTDLAHAPAGPLASIRNVILNPMPTAGQLAVDCRGALDVDCKSFMHGGPFGDPGMAIVAAVPMILLLCCAEGLRRGSRMALWCAVALNLLLGIFSAIYLQLFAQFGKSVVVHGRSVPVETGIVTVLPVVLAPLVLAALLLVWRRHFTVDADPKLRRRIVELMGITLIVFIAVYAVAWFVEDNDAERPDIFGFLATLPRILLPYPFPFRYSIQVFPHGFYSRLFFDFGGAVFWLVFLVGMLLLFLRRGLSALGSGGERDAARSLVFDGGGSLGWMTLWPRNRYWFNSTGTAAVAYQQHFNVAVTVGGPVGSAADRDDAVSEFTAYCERESLIPCWYSAGGELWPRLQELGFRRVAVAEETLLPLENLQFRGKEWQNVRTALNKAKKLDIDVLWSTYSQLPVPLRTQLNEMSEEWVAEKSLPEMGFTLGSIEEVKDDAVRLALAVNADGFVHGVTSWLPVYSHGTVTSWTLDFMRRGKDSFPGTMEFLIASAAMHFQGQVSEISLSGSPLVPPQDDGAEENGSEDNAALRRILDLLGNVLEPVYGFRSLAAFKSRFQPRYRTLYLYYSDPLALGSMGRAIAEAYLPNVSVRQRARLLRTLIPA